MAELPYSLRKPLVAAELSDTTARIAKIIGDVDPAVATLACLRALGALIVAQRPKSEREAMAVGCDAMLRKQIARFEEGAS